MTAASAVVRARKPKSKSKPRPRLRLVPKRPEIKIGDVTSFDQLVAGEYDDRGTWHPYCIEAYRAIRKAVATILRGQRSDRYWSKQELIAEVQARLAACQNPKFFTSPNRVGWVAYFAYNTGRDWLRKRIRVARRDERVRERITTGTIPPDTVEVEDKTPKFDPYQFAGERPIPFDSEASVPMLPEDLMTHSEPSTETPESDLISRVNDMLQTLPEYDQRFFWEYFDSRHEYAHSDRDRQRFRQLCKKIQQGVSQTPLK